MSLLRRGLSKALVTDHLVRDGLGGCAGGLEDARHLVCGHFAEVREFLLLYSSPEKAKFKLM